MEVTIPNVEAQIETVPQQLELDTNIKSYQFISNFKNKFTNPIIAEYLIDKFYKCPNHKKIVKGWALYEEEIDNVIIHNFFLSCKCVFTSLVGLEVVDVEHYEQVKIIVTVQSYYPKPSDNKLKIRLIQESHSFLYNFIGMLQIMAGNAPTESSSSYYLSGGSLTDTANASANLFVANMFNAPSGNSSYGIVIGTGSTANSTSTIALQSQIANGTGSGQMQYNANNYTTITISGSTVSFQMNRTFTNNSGASITVAEVGLYLIDIVSGAYFAVERTVLASAVTVANTAPIQVIYTISLTIQ